MSNPYNQPTIAVDAYGNPVHVTPVYTQPHQPMYVQPQQQHPQQPVYVQQIQQMVPKQPQQQQSNVHDNKYKYEDEEKTTNEVTKQPPSKPHVNKFEWIQTPNLWKGGRVTMHDTNIVTVTGSVCVVADIEINEKNGRFEWEIFAEKIPNRCWIGIVPGPI